MNGKWSRSEAKSGSFRWYSRVRESTAVCGCSSILYEKALPLFSFLFFFMTQFLIVKIIIIGRTTQFETRVRGRERLMGVEYLAKCRRRESEIAL